MITTAFNDKTGVLETIFDGEITVSSVIEYILGLSKNESLPKNLKIFTDASNAWFSKDTKPEDLFKISQANEVSLAQRDFIYDAFIVSGKMEAALGQLYQEFSLAENYKFSIFSNKESALDWLNLF